MITMVGVGRQVWLSVVSVGIFTLHTALSVNGDYPPGFKRAILTLPLNHPDLLWPVNTRNSTNATFPLHYSYNAESYRPGGTIVFVPGDQLLLGKESLRRVGFLADVAPHLHAAVVVAEQRFFGRSQSLTGSKMLTWDDLSYLTTEQILLDYIRLLGDFQNRTLGAENKAGLVVFSEDGYTGVFAHWLAYYCKQYFAANNRTGWNIA